MKENILQRFLFLKETIASDGITESSFWGDAHKRNREWMVLGAAVACLKEKGVGHPITAAEMSPPNPDFRTFDTKGDVWADIEVTECIPSGWRKGDFYKNAKADSPYPSIASNSESPESALKTLDERIASKSKQVYAPHSSLLVYFNIHIYRNRGKQFPQICDILNSKDVSQITTRSFQKVFILSPGMDSIAILNK